MILTYFYVISSSDHFFIKEHLAQISQRFVCLSKLKIVDHIELFFQVGFYHPTILIQQFFGLPLPLSFKARPKR